MRQYAWWSGRSASRLALLIAVAGLIPACLSVCVASSLSYVPNEFIIRVAEGTSLTVVEQAVDRLGATVVKPVALPDTYLIRLGKSTQLRSAYQTSIHRVARAQSFQWVIQSISPNAIAHPFVVPNDELWANMWNMRLINAPQAWELEKGSSDVVVAVVDTGTANHPDLSGRIIAGYDAYDQDSDPSNDVIGHGTHVSGTAAAQGGNGIGVVGVCWDGVKIMPVRVLGEDDEKNNLDTLLAGLDFVKQQASAHPKMVVNMSLGFDNVTAADLPDLERKLQELATLDPPVVLVASAGNSGDTSDPIVRPPAVYDECIAVASVGPYDEIAPYSSYGPNNEVDIAAPGGDSEVGSAGWVWSTTVTWDGSTPTYGYEGAETTDDGQLPWQGTSMAAPCVSGAAALLMSHGVAPADVRSRLLDAARLPTGVSYDAVKFGAGILDVQTALANASIKITSPAKGGTVKTNPEFKIAVQGISPSSVKVYVDYADSNDDGIPENADDGVVIDGNNVMTYLNTAQTAITFKWSDFFTSQMYAGKHNIYAVASPAAGGDAVSDWGVFTVSKQLISKGIHMFAFPYVLTDRANLTPSLVLPEAKFGYNDSPRATLIRYVAAPRSLKDSTPLGYQTYSPSNSSDPAWVYPFYTLGSTTLPTGGGYAVFDTIGSSTATFCFPAGTGFWLVLPTDAYIDESWASSTRGPLEGITGFDGSKGFGVRLYKGWNMIGNPYTHSIPWRASLFTYKGQTKSLLDAEAAGWVRSTLYGYGNSSTGYERVTDRDLLEPYTGYWIMARVGGPTQAETLTMNMLP